MTAAERCLHSARRGAAARLPASHGSKRTRVPTLSRLLAVVVLALLCLATPAFAQRGEPDPEGEAVQGSLRHEGEPVEGAVIVVETEDGEPVGEMESGPDGSFQMEMPWPGRYRATLDEETLPTKA